MDGEAALLRRYEVEVGKLSASTALFVLLNGMTCFNRDELAPIRENIEKMRAMLGDRLVVIDGQLIQIIIEAFHKNIFDEGCKELTDAGYELRVERVRSYGRDWMACVRTAAGYARRYFDVKEVTVPVGLTNVLLKDDYRSKVDNLERELSKGALPVDPKVRYLDDLDTYEPLFNQSDEESPDPQSPSDDHTSDD